VCATSAIAQDILLGNALKVVEDLVVVVEADVGTVSATNVMGLGISLAIAEKNKTGVTAVTVLATFPEIVNKMLMDHPATTVTRLATLHVNAQNHQTGLVVDPVARAITATRRGTLHATAQRGLRPKVAISVARLAT
jgi:hypothetical protein